MEPKLITRDEVKRERKTIHKETKTNGNIRIRMIPIWLRLVLLLAGIVCMATLGTIIGYSVIGDGKPFEIFDKETWIHIIELTG